MSRKEENDSSSCEGTPREIDDVFSASSTPPNSHDRLKELEEEYELLNSSLIALTTHFAQVQFRLRQIVEAAPSDKESLLKNLEEFAFRGIPDVKCSPIRLVPSGNDLERALSEQRIRQNELIDRLKVQLTELENYAYEAGDGGPPQSMLIERQRVVIDRLKTQLNLDSVFEDLDKMSVDELKRYVDSALGEVMVPLKMKEQLVGQLKTQLADLERFIQFLQEGSVGTNTEKCTCNCTSCSDKSSISRKDEMRGRLVTTMKRISALLHIFASTQLLHPPNSRKFRRNSPKRTMKTKHWGDLRAQLEMAIEAVIELAKEPDMFVDSDYVSDSECSSQSTSRLATVVRKQLAVALQNLLQHGLMGNSDETSIVPFVMCFRITPSSPTPVMHAWELLLRFYELKNGEQFNSTPARKLSQSFNLDIAGGSKQSLLGVIGNIVASHDLYKRSYDAQFKAFVCAGLNSRCLVAWLRLVLRCQPLLEEHYADWSYVVKTGFEDALVSLDKLSAFTFHLPVDLAIRQLIDIKDAF